MPDSNRFGPLDSPTNSASSINMTVDEYESIRLIDLEGLTQEECAGQMNISRTTVQGIYVEARKKIAQSLVDGKILFIEGGEYQLCNGLEEGCGGGRCQRHRCGRNSEESGVDSSTDKNAE